MLNLSLSGLDMPPLPRWLRWRLRSIVGLLVLLFTSALAVAIGTLWSLAHRSDGWTLIVFAGTIGVLVILLLVLYALLAGVWKVTKGEEK